MEGITILNTEQYITSYAGGFSPSMLICLIPLAAFITTAAYVIMTKDSQAILPGVVLLIATIMVCIVAYQAGNPIYADQYICTIEDSVSINEVYDNYEVVERNGELYTLRPLE